MEVKIESCFHTWVLSGLKYLHPFALVLFTKLIFFLMIVSLVISDHSWFAKTIIINISSDICQDFVKQQFLLYGLFEYLKSDQK